MTDYIMDGSGIKRLRLLEPMGEPDIIECDGHEYAKVRTCNMIFKIFLDGVRWQCEDCGGIFEEKYYYCPDCGAKVVKE